MENSEKRRVSGEVPVDVVGTGGTRARNLRHEVAGARVEVLR